MVRAVLFACVLPAILSAQADYRYAFAPPHRITVGQPGGSVKTLLDAEPGLLTVSWTYDDLRTVPLAVWKAPAVRWRVRVSLLLDGQPVSQSSWRRSAQGLPVLHMDWAAGKAEAKLEMAGSDDGAIGRLAFSNREARPCRFTLRAELQGGWVAHNPAWVNPSRDAAALLAMQNDRADRVLILAAGGAPGAPQKKAFEMSWTVAPGGQARGWIIRPQNALEAALPALRRRDWQAAYDAALESWKHVMAAADRFGIPEPGAALALRASLADLFIMREPLADGYTGVICGTEIYRSTNPFEPSLAAITLDQMGLHEAAADGHRVHIDMQEPDGNWNDPGGWAHDMWGGAGMKAWAVMEHYRLTGDRAYLEKVYPRMVASSRWQAAQRRSGGTGGLMPRGMGDGGLMNGTDHFGVFYPHNFLAVMGDRLAAEAAAELSRTAEAAELRAIYETALAALHRSLEEGSIQDQSGRWIPGGPGNSTGSRWGALYSLFPARVLPPDHPLIESTIRKLETNLSPGGQPIHTGWMADGAWPAITLDNLAQAHLVRGNGDASAGYLHSTLNHATPLLTWCEERGLEPGSSKTSGDRQHLWTPLAVVRLVRDSLVMEWDGELRLATGTPREWLLPGRSVTVREAPTHFGPVSYRIEAAADSVRAEIEPPRRRAPAAIQLALRRASRDVPKKVTLNGQPAAFDPRCDCMRLPVLPRKMTVEALY